MRENNLKDKNMPSIKGMEGGLTIRTYRCGGGWGGEGKRILSIIHKTLDTVKGLGFEVTDHILESSGQSDSRKIFIGEKDLCFDNHSSRGIRIHKVLTRVSNCGLSVDP